MKNRLAEFSEERNPKRRFSLTEAEKASLIRHYVAFGFAADQLGNNPNLLFELTDRFNEENNSGHSPGNLLKFIITQRKNGDWVKLGEKSKRLFRHPVELTLIELSALKALYLRNGVGLDEYMFHPQLAQRLSDGLRLLTGKIVSKGDLVGFIMKMRKAKRWVKLDTNPEPFEAIIDLKLLDQFFDSQGEEAV